MKSTNMKIINLPDEEWKDIEAYVGRYQVSNMGRIKSLAHLKSTWKGGDYITKEKILRDQNAKGYRFIRICNETGTARFQVNRLVAFAFISNPENKPFTNHINGIRHDNRAVNLEWVTHLENVRHAIDVLGKHQRGERCHMAKVNETTVKEIRNLYNSGAFRLIDLAEKYEMSIAGIHVIVKNKTWKHLTI